MLDRYWLDHARHKPSAITLSYYIEALQGRLDTTADLDAFGNNDVARYVAARRLEVAPATVNRETATLRAAWNMAGDVWEWPVRRIAWRRHRLDEPQGRTRHVTPAKARALIKALPEPTARAVSFAILTGLRRSELAGLAWEQIDMHRRTARVLGKGRKWATIELGPEAWTLLATMPPADPARPAEPRAGAVFDLTNLRKRWTAACTAAKLTDFRFHDLRHTFATWMRQRGAPLELVQEALRHADIGTTRRYAHVTRPELKAAVKRISLTKG